MIKRAKEHVSSPFLSLPFLSVSFRSVSIRLVSGPTGGTERKRNGVVAGSYSCKCRGSWRKTRKALNASKSRRGPRGSVCRLSSFLSRTLPFEGFSLGCRALLLRRRLVFRCVFSVFCLLSSASSFSTAALLLCFSLLLWTPPATRIQFVKRLSVPKWNGTKWNETAK